MSSFRLNPKFADALLRSAGVRDLLEDKANAAAARAAELAPDDPTTTVDDLRRSIYGEVALTVRGWVGRVGATNFKAHWYEEGAQGVPAQPYLRPAVEAEVGPIEGPE